MPTKTQIRFGSLKTRITPSQLRAQERVHQILNATADELCSSPPHDVSALMIAKSANIPVSSIYRYFPKVEDIFEELYQQISGDFEARVFSLLEDSETYPGWRDRHRGVYTAFRSFCREHPYYMSLLQYSISRFGPETIDFTERPGLTGYLASRWAEGGDGFRGGDPKIVAHITMQTFLAIEGFVASNIAPTDVDAYLSELSLNLESYLANYLSDER
ncbi:MAG: TetR/AcrR family transcriptional regulator [Henriciella sp.]